MAKKNKNRKGRLRRFKIVSGRVTEALPNDMFRVQKGASKTILANVSSMLVQNKIEIEVGNRVKVSMGSSGPNRGTIIKRQ